jgi:hypothetical protein
MLKINKAEIENFWYYYKVHTIVAIFIAFILIMTLKDCANRIEPDVSIAYIGGNYIGYEAVEDIKSSLSDIITDINGDEKSEVSLQILNISGDSKSEEEIAMQQRAMLLFAAGEVELLIVDKEQFQRYASQGFFEPIPDLADKYSISIEDFPELKVTQQEEKEEDIYGLPLEGSKFLGEKGVRTEEHYLALKVVALKEKDDENKLAMYDNAYLIIDKLMER